MATYEHISSKSICIHGLDSTWYDATSATDLEHPGTISTMRHIYADHDQMKRYLELIRAQTFLTYFKMHENEM